MNKNIFIIGISGGTGSGKTSIANAISKDFPSSELVLIEQDSYYKDLSKLSFEERAKINFDHPNSIDFELLENQLKNLLDGKKIESPIYDYKTHTRSNNTKIIYKQRVIILEGIFAFYNNKIRNMMNIKLYVETADDIRLLRRIKRDMKKRERTLSSVMEQYESTVRPMYLEFVELTKKYADIIIPEGKKNKVAINLLRTKIKSLLLTKS